MNASARTAARLIRDRRRAHRAAKRPHTLAGHGRLAGLDASAASSVGGALRSKAKTLGVEGTPARLFRRDSLGRKVWKAPVPGARRYTLAQFAQLVTAYRPRAPRLAEAKSVLAAYAS